MKSKLIPVLLFGIMLLTACNQAMPAPAPALVQTTEPAVAAEEAQQLAAPEQDMALYMPRNVQLAYDNGTRSLDGNPGPNFSQNHAVHDISITVSPPSPTISGTEEITYTNNSQNYLSALPVRLYMNVHLPEAQRELNHTPDFLTSGVHIDEFSINGEVTPWMPIGGSGITYKIIRLPLPLAPGDSVNLSFDWHYDLATETKHEGVVDPTTFFVGYFFPRIAVYNDTDGSSIVPGFDLEEFTYRSGRERFDDFADFTVAVNAPKDFVVWATGDLQNPEEVLQPTYAQRLETSMTSDEIVNIATPEETQQGQVTAQADTVTWKWKADHVTTFAFGLSDHYVWDAGSVVVEPDTGRRASVQAAYPVEAEQYKGMVDNGKVALEFGSTKYPGIPYPFSKMTIFVGDGDEEFPMMANDSAEAPSIPGATATVRFVAAHELLHSWLPFYLGSDERRYPMIDEGWTTAFEYLFGLDDVGKEQADALFKAVRSSRLLPAAPGTDIPIITPADATRGDVTSNNAYEKSALAYLALKDLMGDEAFKASLHEFIARWHGNHPLPWDMFNTFNDTYEENLNWFFNNWFFESNYLDLAIADVEQGAGETMVTVNNVGGFAIPFDLIVRYADDTTETFHQTPAIWKDSPDTATITIPSSKEVKVVEADGGIFVDVTDADNAFPPKPSPDSNAPVIPVIAQVANADGTESIAMTLPPKTIVVGGGQFNLPSGVIAILATDPAGSSPVDVIKQAAAAPGVQYEDSEIVDGDPIAGYPSKVLRSTVTLGGTAYGWDAYAFSTAANTYHIVLAVPYPPALDKLRANVYPELIESVVVEP